MDDAPVRRPQLDELETFLLAAKHASLTKAAQELRLSKTAASKRLRALEALVGRRLLDRGPRGVTLTEDGRRLVPRVEELLRESDRVFGLVSGLRQGYDPDRISGLRSLSGADVSTERVLQDTERIFSEIFHSVQDGIVVMEAEAGTFLEVNDEFARIVGLPREAVIGRTGAELGLAPESTHGAMVSEVRSSGAVESRTIELPAADGVTRNVEFSLRLVTLAGEERLLGVGREITERVLHERTIVRQAAQQEAVAELTLAALAGEPLEAVLARAAEVAGSHVDADLVAIGDLAGDSLELRSGYGAPFDEFAVAIRRAERAVHHLAAGIAEGEVLVEDLTRDRRFARDAKSFEVRSMAAVPVTTGDAVIGVLAAAWAEPAGYRPSDVHFLHAVANVLGVMTRSERRREKERRTEILVENFKALVEESPDATALISLEGHYVYLNAAARRTREIDPEVDPAALSIYDNLDARAARRLRDVVLPETQSSGRWEGAFTVARTSSGRRTRGRLTTILVHDPQDGSPRWIAAIFRPAG
jgi:PAS domain S-box-containing protein